MAGETDGPSIEELTGRRRDGQRFREQILASRDKSYEENRQAIVDSQRREFAEDVEAAADIARVSNSMAASPGEMQRAIADIMNGLFDLRDVERLRVEPIANGKTKDGLASVALSGTYRTNDGKEIELNLCNDVEGRSSMYIRHPELGDVFVELPSEKALKYFQELYPRCQKQKELSDKLAGYQSKIDQGAAYVQAQAELLKAADRTFLGLQKPR